jgi:GH25 family lysozyme M1 (1,4-beta-N-acetylmuramidase)
MPGLPGAYVPWVLNACRDAGSLVYNEDGQPGDPIMFDWNGDGNPDHIGICEVNHPSEHYMETIEGNTNNGCVARRTRSYSNIIGCARPSWDGSTPAPQPTPAPEEQQAMNGIDIYSGEGDNGINISQVKGDFVIIKATQGTNYVNPYFSRWVNDVPNSGKKLGIYHYASGGNATDEANHFCDVIGSTKGLLALDWESNAGNGENPVFNSGNDANWIAEFRNQVHARTGVWALVYTSRAYIGNTGVSSNYLWVAQYGYSDQGLTDYRDSPKFEGQFDCAIRQYASDAHIPGYGGELDINKAYFSPDRWDQYANGAGIQPDTPSENTISEDGYAGSATIYLAQAEAKAKGYNAMTDGCVSGQVDWVLNQPGIRNTQNGVWLRGNDGSLLVMAIQHVLGVEEDGFFGPDTWHALEAREGSCIDNTIEAPSCTIQKWQHELNQGTFF